MAKGFTTELESLAETVPVLQSMSMDLQVMSQSLVGSNIIVGPIYTHLEAALGRYSDCRDTLARQVGQGEAAIAATADALAGIVEVYSRADGQS